MKGLPLKPFYFLRHSKTDWNLEHRAMGSQDIPLNDRGVSQGLNAAELLKNEPIATIVSSPLLRARKDCRYHCPAHKGSCHRNH